jgi:hypothetical protein
MGGKRPLTIIPRGRCNNTVAGDCMYTTEGSPRCRLVIGRGGLAPAAASADLHALACSVHDGSRTPARMAMETSAIITFVVIAGLVWGGFFAIIAVAIRKEGRKTDEG